MLVVKRAARIAAKIIAVEKRMYAAREIVVVRDPTAVQMEAAALPAKIVLPVISTVAFYVVTMAKSLVTARVVSLNVAKPSLTIRKSAARTIT